MQSNSLRLAAVLLCSVPLACSGPEGFNRLDPEAPADQQARAAVRGRLRLVEPAAVAAGVRVRLLHEDGSAVTDPRDNSPRSALATALPGDGGAQGLAEFLLGEIPPGSYRVAVDVDPRYEGPAPQIFALRPGDVRDLGELTFTLRTTGTGRVSGAVVLRDATGGARLVQLFRSTADGLRLAAQQRTDADGRFAFDALPPGTYAVGAELEGFTPDYRAGFQLETPGALTEEVRFDGDDALVLHSVSAVLLPALPMQGGTWYTSADSVGLNVLAFGGMDRMRLATDARFVDREGKELPFDEYVAAREVALPDVQGPVTVLAQFRNQRSARFVFTSPPFGVTLVRDVTPPVLSRVALRGAVAAADGNVWLGSAGLTVSVEAEGSDAHSAVAAVSVVQREDNGPGDVASLAFDPVDSTGGLAVLVRQTGLTAGDGEKIIWTRLRDRAGNTSEPVSLSVKVDSTPPQAELVLEGGADFALSPVVRAELRVADDGGAPVTGFWLSNTGTFPAAPQPLAGPVAWSLAAPELGELKTVHARVVDAAGHVSDVQAQIRLDLADPAGRIEVQDGAEWAKSAAVSVRALGDGGTGHGFAVSSAPLDCAAAEYAPFDGDERVNVTLGDDGTHVIHACFREPSGRTTHATATIRLDTMRPASPSPLAPLSGEWSRNNRPQLRWSSIAGADHFVVSLSKGGGAATGFPRAVATNELVPDALADGDWNWSVVAVDAAGNESAVASGFPALLRVDTQAPSAPDGLSAGAKNPSANPLPRFTWSAAADPDNRTAAADLAYLLEVADGTSFANLRLRTALTGGTSFDAATRFADGTYAWRLTVSDLAGNTVVQAGPAFSIDTTPPPGPVFALVTTPTRSPVALSWSAVAAADAYALDVRSLSDSDPSCTAFSDTRQTATASATVAVPDGPGCLYEAHVSALDALGNRSASDRVRFVVDTVKPSAPAPFSPEPGAWNRTGLPTLRWSAVDAIRYRVSLAKDGVAVNGWPAEASTNEVAPASALADGDYDWSVTAVDAAGNESAISAAFPARIRIDTRAPTGLDALPATTTAGSRDVALSWVAATDPDARTPAAALSYFVEIAAGAGFSAIRQSATVTGLTAITLSGLPDGIHAWRVTVSDLAGNSFTRDGAAFTVDTTPPPVPSFAAVASPTRGPLALTWSPVAGAAKYRLRVQQVSTDASCPAFTPVDREVVGTSSSVALGSGPACVYEASVASVDDVGNASLFDRVRFVVDTVAPAAPLALAPASSSWDGTGLPTLKWTSVADAAKYRVTLARSGTPVVGWPVETAAVEVVPASALADGDYDWSVTALDAVGNESTVEPRFPWRVRIDTRAPVALDPLSAQIDGSNNGLVHLSWNAATDPDAATAPADLTYVVEIAESTSFAALRLTATLTGRTSLDVAALSDGPHAWRVTVADRAGNTLAQEGPVFTIDTTPPPAPSFAAVRTPTRGPVSFSWTPVAGAAQYQLSVYRTGSEAGCSAFEKTVLQQATTTATVALGTGPSCAYEAAVASLDDAGNVGAPDRVRFTVDTVAPDAPAGVSPDDGTWDRTGVPSLRWTPVADAARYRVSVARGGTVLPGWPVETTAAEMTPAAVLADGEYEWSVTALDAVGNESETRTMSIGVDKTAPTTPVIVSPDQVVNVPAGSAQVLVRIAAPTTEANFAAYEVLSEPSDATFATVSTDRASVRFAVPVAEGVANRIRLRARDLAGNTSPESFVTITEDSTAPAPVRLARPAATHVNADAVSVFLAPDSETAHDPTFARYEVQVNDGAWSPTPLRDGFVFVLSQGTSAPRLNKLCLRGVDSARPVDGDGNIAAAGGNTGAVLDDPNGTGPTSCVTLVEDSVFPTSPTVAPNQMTVHASHVVVKVVAPSTDNGSEDGVVYEVKGGWELDAAGTPVRRQDRFEETSAREYFRFALKPDERHELCVRGRDRAGNTGIEACAVVTEQTFRHLTRNGFHENSPDTWGSFVAWQGLELSAGSRKPAVYQLDRRCPTPRQLQLRTDVVPWSIRGPRIAGDAEGVTTVFAAYYPGGINEVRAARVRFEDFDYCPDTPVATTVIYSGYDFVQELDTDGREIVFFRNGSIVRTALDGAPLGEIPDARPVFDVPPRVFDGTVVWARDNGDGTSTLKRVRGPGAGVVDDLAANLPSPTRVVIGSDAIAWADNGRLMLMAPDAAPPTGCVPPAPLSPLSGCVVFPGMTIDNVADIWGGRLVLEANGSEKDSFRWDAGDAAPRRLRAPPFGCSEGAVEGDSIVCAQEGDIQLLSLSQASWDTVSTGDGIAVNLRHQPAGFDLFMAGDLLAGRLSIGVFSPATATMRSIPMSGFVRAETADDEFPVAGGSWVAWIEPGQGSAFSLKAADLSQPTFPVTQLSASAAPVVRSLAVDAAGTRVAWVERSGDVDEIAVLPLPAGTATPRKLRAVTTTDGQYLSYVSLSEQIAVWQEVTRRDGQWMESSARCHNLADDTSGIVVPFGPAGQQEGPANAVIAGRGGTVWMVWEQRSAHGLQWCNLTCAGGVVSCVAHTLDPNSSGGKVNASLDENGRVVWQTAHRAGGYEGIELAELGTDGRVLRRESVGLELPPSSRSWPSIRGNRILWSDMALGGMSLFMHQLAH